MRAIVVGSAESSRIAIEAITRAEGWSLPLVISLPPELAHRHSDYADLNPAAKAAGARMLPAPDINMPGICEAVEAIAPDHVFVIGWSQICRDRFMAAGIMPARIRFERLPWVFRHAGPPSELLDIFRLYYGPTMNAYAAAEGAGKAGDLHHELLDLFNGQNRGGDQTSIPATYLKVTVSKE